MVLFPGCKCCKCPVDTTLVWGGETSSAVSFSVDFPSAEHCVKVVITITAGLPEIIITSRTIGVSGATILYGWASDGSVTLCLKKAAGRDRLQIDLRNNEGTAGTIAITCDTCDCNPLP